MAEYINVTVQTTQPRKISVKPSTVAPNLQVSVDPTEQNAKISRDWAIGEGLIQNEDYSSKTWAGESKSSADLSKMYSEAASLDLNNLETLIIQYDEQLNTTITNGLENINTTVASGVETMEITKTEASEYVETTANESIAEVNQAKEQAIKDFNKASDKVNYLFVMPIGTIGFSPFPIDETKGLRRTLNGQIIIQEQFTGFVKWLKENIELYPQMACTEGQWQATVTMSTFGQCGKFVIDDEAGTIRLPKITGFIQGLTDLASLGELVEAGLPTLTTNSTGAHTHTRGTMDITGQVLSDAWTSNSDINTGAFYSEGSSSKGSSGDDSRSIAKFQASRSWTGETSSNGEHTHTITGTSDTVQPESIRYPYFIQVATGAEERVDVTREIELNNPFFFGYYQYFEVAPNNISWLKSEGQWNSKAIYTDYYDWILTNANNGIANFKLSTDTYDDYCWVVNTADETFRLPIKTKNAPFTVNGTANVSVYGNGERLGFNANGSGLYEMYESQVAGTAHGTVRLNKYGDSGDYIPVGSLVGITTDASKSGLTGKATVLTSENTNVSLYFYVGETTQNANLVNVGRIEEGKVNRAGDTITGSLGVKSGVFTDRLEFTNANSNNGGYIDFHFNGDNTVDYTSRIIEDASGRVTMIASNGFNFPKCTTKATTSTSASNYKPAVVVQNYVSGTSWYRAWSDGWIEQGGKTSATEGAVTVTLLKAFTNTNYSVVTTGLYDSGSTANAWDYVKNITTNSFVIHQQSKGCLWRACGY